MFLNESGKTVEKIIKMLRSQKKIYLGAGGTEFGVLKLSTSSNADTILRWQRVKTFLFDTTTATTNVMD